MMKIKLNIKLEFLVEFMAIGGILKSITWFYNYNIKHWFAIKTFPLKLQIFQINLKQFVFYNVLFYL